MKRKLTAALCAAAAISLLTGCGKGKEEISSAKKSSGKAVEMIIENGAEPQSIDPSKIQGTTEDRINRALFEGLVVVDPKDSHAIPGVAESWEREGDGSVVVFHLRKNAVWSDGTPITAKTFVDSWLYYLAPETAAVYAYMPAMVIKGAFDYNAGTADKSSVGLKARDDYTLEVDLVGPVPYAVDMMCHYSFGPLPMHAIEKFGNDWIKAEHFVGNGPYVLSEWTPQEKVVVKKNEKYWNKDNVFIDTLTFLPIENTTTAYNKYKAGEIDWNTTNCFPPDMLDEVKLRDDYQVTANLASYYAEFNVNDPVLKDPRVRKALVKALDCQELVDKVTKGGQLATGAFVPEMSGYTPVKGHGFNVAEAKKLLADAGYPDGKGFPRMTYIYNTNEGHKKIAEWVQQQWKANLGINIDLQNMEWKTYLAKRQANDFQIARAGWVGDYQDPSNFLELLLSTSGNNDGSYNNPEFDALIKKASMMPEGEDRMSVLEKAEDIAIMQDCAVIPMYIYVSQNLIDLNKWEGWYSNTQDLHPYVGLKKIAD